MLTLPSTHVLSVEYSIRYPSISSGFCVGVAVTVGVPAAAVGVGVPSFAASVGVGVPSFAPSVGVGVPFFATSVGVGSSVPGVGVTAFP